MVVVEHRELLGNPHITVRMIVEKTVMVGKAVLEVTVPTDATVIVAM
jgi:hypothetical protein